MTVAELGTKPLLEVRGLKMHFPVTDLTRTMRPRLGETRRRILLALGHGYRRDGWDVRQILLDYLFYLSTLPGLDPDSISQWLEWGISCRRCRRQRMTAQGSLLVLPESMS
jgi:hypothetical protein